MKILIVFTHPNPKSFTHAIVDKLEKISANKSYEVKTLDLYKEDFDPVLRAEDFKKTSEQVLAFQSYITWADCLVFVYPIWWGQMPALLKGFLDKTLSFGFAFNAGEDGTSYGMFSNKVVYSVVNFGMDKLSQEEAGISDAVKKLHLLNNFTFCGIAEENCKIKYFYSVPKIQEEDRSIYLDELESWFV